MTTIKAKKDLYNDEGVKCFTSGKTYISQKTCYVQSSLITAITKNDNDQWHTLGTWYEHFEIINLETSN